MHIIGTHHVAVMCSDYERSKRFYVEVLGLEVIAEVYREARRSYKLDLQMPDGTQVELFSFPDPPQRPSYPEACGLRQPPPRPTCRTRPTVADRDQPGLHGLGRRADSL